MRTVPVLVIQTTTTDDGRNLFDYPKMSKVTTGTQEAVCSGTTNYHGDKGKRRAKTRGENGMQ